MQIGLPDANLSVNDQSLVLKRGSRLVVPDDNGLRTLLISELHDSMYAGYFGMARTRAAVGRMCWWESPSLFLPV
jgi:hypothetical protein